MIRLHHAHQTRSMRSLWLLHELDVPFDLVERPFDATLRSADYLALHPAGRVPALEIDGHRMFETGAITEYLCERFPEAGLGRPPGDDERMEWLIWVHFAETVSQHAAALTQQHVILFEDHMRSPVVMKIEARRLEKCYAALDARLSGAQNRTYLLDTGFTAADISVGQALYMSRHFAKIEPFAALTQWYERITQRPGFLASLPPEHAVRLYPKSFYPPTPG
ncbi:MAG: glutathione S-transferase family protein [Pseudomonadota bacterium]